MRIYENEMRITEKCIKNNYNNCIFNRPDISVCKNCGKIVNSSNKKYCEDCAKEYGDK